MKETGNNKRRGSALGLAVIAMMVIVLAGLAMLMMAYQSRMRAIYDTSENVARAAADSGLRHAIYLINRSVWNKQPLDLATINGVARPLESSNSTYTLNIGGDPISGFVISSTGEAGRARKTVHATTTMENYWWGIGVEKGITLVNKSVVGSVPSGKAVEVRTNSKDRWAVSIQTVIEGDLVIGPGGDINTVIQEKPGSTINGDKYAADSKLIFPPVIPPEGLPSMTYVAGTDLVSGEYNNISIGQSATATIGGPNPEVVIYVTGKMTLNQLASLIVPEGYSLKLYLGTELVCGQDSNLDNQNNTAANLRIYGLPTCKKIDIKNSGDLFASVYAPQTDVTIYAKGDFCGSVIAESFTLNNSGNFYYDMSLLGLNDEDAKYAKIVRWWED